MSEARAALVLALDECKIGGDAEKAKAAALVGIGLAIVELADGLDTLGIEDGVKQAAVELGAISIALGQR